MILVGEKEIIDYFERNEIEIGKETNEKLEIKQNNIFCDK